MQEDLVEEAARLLAASRHAVALTGAGVSTESGIPDFRGPSGIWTRNPEAERRAYRTYQLFLTDPKRYWEERLSRPSLLGDLSKAQPNPSHYALAKLEKLGVIKCVITQNIDALHLKAGSVNVIEYHGNAFKLRCPHCNARYNVEEYDLEGLKQRGELPPRCRRCGSPLKADVVHFNEPIPQDVMLRSLQEVYRCDLALICGTSAVVYPFAELPRIAWRRGAIIIEVNLEPTPLTLEGISTIFIQGKTGEILPKIADKVEEIVEKKRRS